MCSGGGSSRHFGASAPPRGADPLRRLSRRAKPSSTSPHTRAAPFRAAHCARRDRPRVAHVRWWRRLTTRRWLARFVALLGVVNIVSALVPAWKGRLALLAEVVPAVAPAAATAGTAAVGVLLVVLA